MTWTRQIWVFKLKYDVYITNFFLLWATYYLHIAMLGE